MFKALASILKTRKIYYIPSVLLMAIVFSFQFVPEVFGFYHPYSYYALSEKNEEIESMKEEHRSNKNNLESSYRRLVSMKTQKEHLGEYYQEIAEKADEGLWSLHEPSILVFLEQNASYFGLDIEIDYSAMSSMTTEEDIEEDEAEEDSEEERDEEESDSEENEEEEEAEENEEEEKSDEDEGSEGAKQQQMYRIPVELKGSYKSVGEFLYYLGQTDLVSVPDAHLIQAGGGALEAEIFVEVYSLE